MTGARHPDASRSDALPADRPATQPAEGAPTLYTPAQAAAALAVPESWLRRKAGRRLIPCTMLGKHLGFTQADLARIAERGEQTVRPTRRGMRLT